MHHAPFLARHGARLAAAALAVVTLSPVAPAQVARGTRPEFVFGEPLVNGMGAMSLADLQGKLTWIEFWGTY